MGDNVGEFCVRQGSHGQNLSEKQQEDAALLTDVPQADTTPERACCRWRAKLPPALAR